MSRTATAASRDLRQANVDFFHAREHWNLKSKPYHGLSVTKRKELLAKLIRHINTFCHVGFSVTLDAEEYKALTDNRFRSDWGAPYSFAIQMLFLLIYTDLARRRRTHEAVNVLIEDG